MASPIAYQEAIVVDRAANRTEELESVLTRCEPALYRMARRYSRTPADAEDALQDAMLSAVRHIGEFEGRSQLSTWLTKIVINAARMQFRRRYRHESVSLDQSPNDEGPTYADSLTDDGPSPEENCKDTELQRVLALLMKRLPKSQRIAFQLREVDGLSTREAAQALGVSQGTVKTQLARARGKLGAMLQQYAGLPGPKWSRMRTRPPKTSDGMSSSQASRIEGTTTNFSDAGELVTQ
jgi:RNA polymerase sigma-70 factor (ECF subfamily)